MLLGRINCALEKSVGTHIHREEGMNLFVGMMNSVTCQQKYW